MLTMIQISPFLSLRQPVSYSGQEKTRSNCPGQVNFALRQVKMGGWWYNGLVKLAPVVLSVDKVEKLHTKWVSNIFVGATGN